ncbi:MAG: proline--tRNA ligase [Proteobacteria bacterium]|nr:proline--tRNA ligase [Pseudomonadota bacterium]
MAQDNSIKTREQDYSAWYLDVIREAQLADYSPVKGCMVLRPHGFGVWDNIKNDLDRRFKETGHVNAYFPLFIPMEFLSREAQHVEGFAKEGAVVTHHRLRSVTDANGKVGVEPDPAAKLEEPLIVRPTSETIIWHMYGRWIDSWRDLPLLINQWANVVRWEMKTRPFLRTAEFLWQEGHTAHATEVEAVEEAERMLQVYADFCHETLAIPVITGSKSSAERFAGAEDTYCIEAMMQNTWALQAGTSHFLGQNFAKAFDVTFQNTEGERELVWATSWGVSTRLVGAVIMTHSDDTGLVLPPKVAPIQVVIIPIARKDHERETVMEFVGGLKSELLASGVRVHVDDRTKMKPGAKYYEWERKGVCLRMEVGPRDVKGESAFCKKRTGGDKFSVAREGAGPAVVQILTDIQAELLANATALRVENTHDVADYETFKSELKANGGWYRVAWFDDGEAEARIKDETKATIRCFPIGDQDVEGKTCFYSGKPANRIAIFARAY